LVETTVSKLRQNLFWAFSYNTGLIPVAAGALIPIFGAEMYAWLPFLAAAAMAMSSVSVVGNSLLLGRHKPEFRSLPQEIKRTYPQKRLGEEQKGEKIYAAQPK
jgi:P-type Cu+ transporter